MPNGDSSNSAFKEKRMKKHICLIVIFVFALSATFAISSARERDRLKVEEKEKIERTLRFQDLSKAREVWVDNIFGSIIVEGSSGQEVELVVHKTIKAKNKEKLQKARDEVKLDIKEEGNTIDLYVDGPFRDRDQDGRYRNRWDPGYRVHYEFAIKVPLQTNLSLKTATDGKIRVTNVEGEFDIRHANGKIDLIEVAGSGDAHTANGDVRVIFSKNPESNCSFKTVNGDVSVSFQKNLSADFRLKTFHGDGYSDFPITYLPSRPAQKGREDGKYIYKSDRFVGVRVDRGGPEILMDTLNGDLLIQKR
jgi:hypothetical protein